MNKPVISIGGKATIIDHNSVIIFYIHNRRKCSFQLKVNKHRIGFLFVCFYPWVLVKNP